MRTLEQEEELRKFDENLDDQVYKEFNEIIKQRTETRRLRNEFLTQLKVL